MSKEIYISSTPHETRLAIVENDNLTEIYYERENEYTLAGSIYNGKVTRVLPGMQSSFVDIGLDRDAFLYITDFMEEAGDAADFDGAAGEPRRSSRDTRDGAREQNRGESGRDSGRSEVGRDSRGARESQPRSTETRPYEPSDADLFAEAVSSLDPPRSTTSDSDRSDRGERSERDRNRRGGRTRRDRGGASQDGSRRAGERPASADRSAAPPDRSVASTDRSSGFIDSSASPIERPAPPAEMVSAVDLSATEGAQELGEGAPGADGSRRWRGRRGRRGNRSGERSREISQAAAATAAGAQPLTPPTDLESEGSSFHGAPEEPLSLHAAAEESSPRSEEFSPRSEEFSPRSEQPRQRADRQPRTPRGFAPSTSLYQVDEPSYGAAGEAPAEPIILPGESLSKYRPAGSTPEAVASLAPPPAVSNFVVSGWDGGTVLPGETLRSRGPRPDASKDGSSRPDRGRSGGRDRDRTRGEDHHRSEDRHPNEDRSRGGRSGQPFREDRPSSVASTPRFEAPVSSLSTPTGTESPVLSPTPEQDAQVTEPTYLTDPEHIPASHLITPLDTTQVPPPPRPEVPSNLYAEPVQSNPERRQPEQDFEPTEGSASFRIDPVPPSEYRQSAPTATLEQPAAPRPAAEASVLPDTLDVPESFDAPEASILREWTSEPSTPVLDSDLETAATPLSNDLSAAPQPLTHDLTSINASGEMQSEPFSLMTQDLVAPSTSVQGELQSSTPVAADAVAGDQTLPAPYFAPGDGLLEEEELFEEDELPSAPLPSLQASAGHPEEEMLEGAPDLATMLRERSIDELTGSHAEEMDNDDFEEDFLEEDQSFEGEEDDEEFGAEPSATHTETSEPLEDVSDAGFRDPHTSGHEESFAQPEATTETSEPRRSERGREDRGRRDGRRGDRSRRSGGASGSSDRGRRDGGQRTSAQATNLPAISELLKPGQELLCQIAKEPIAKKGARITSHIALPGRFLVFMPTVHHTGVSRKIESDAERRRLREILLSEKGEAAGGFIVRTAAAGASEQELRSDLRFLLNLWADIKARSESSKSPALIYHDLNLVERVLRDQVTDTFSAIWVDTETEYERVLRFLQRFQPSLIRRVKLYTKETPLYEQFGITEEINKALRSKVWLKSGGSIVINQTEALVAIDINTGKFVGKTARLEDTIVKTNLDAIPEIVRQIRLRDLGGIIIIDFIDMDERKNRNKVMAALEDELKTDRAPSKILPFNDFGLVAITRKRVKQSLERTLSTTCGICAGTGMTKSPVTICNDIYVEMRKMHKNLDRGDVMLRVHPEVVKQLKSTSSHWLQEMEEMVGKTILVKSDPSLHPEQFDIH